MLKKNNINTTTEEKVLAVIEQVRLLEIKKGFEPLEVYLTGDCGNLFFILKEKFPKAIPYIRGKHVITCIGGKFYDIRGEYQNSTDNIKKATLADVKNSTNHYNNNKSRKCQSFEEKLRYSFRAPTPETIPLKTRMRILRDDFKQIQLKDLPVYFNKDVF